MIIYSEDKKTFMANSLEGTLIPSLDRILSQRLRRAARNEINAWRSSLQYMYMVLNDSDIPDDAGVAIEYVIPTSSKRIDFLVSGYGDNAQANAVIVELKQWSEAKPIYDQNDMVKTFVGGGYKTLPHPSYQAWSYAQLIYDFNESVQQNDIDLHPCSYLHNYKTHITSGSLYDASFADLIKRAPLFDQEGSVKLREFIKRYIRRGDQRKILYDIDNGRIRPSKSLQDSLRSMLDGNKEFVMIDDQKTVYEQTISMAEKTGRDQKKRVYIVEGGPGTGKSVVAINLLVELSNRQKVCHYVTRNSAPRDVYKVMLKGHRNQHSVDNLFKSANTYFDAPMNSIDVAIVDEAHRLTEKSGFYGNEGENQIKEIIEASRCSVFFIDEDQIVTMKDVGTIDAIKQFAKNAGAIIFEDALMSQFRCNGSDGYIAWLDDVLQIRETANPLFDLDYDIQIVDDPHELMAWVREKNEQRNKARVIAGYCWEWPKDNRADPTVNDISMPEFDFGMSWNLNNHIWAINPCSVEQAGCIHTSQGLEFDYIGIIIGNDMRYEDGHVVTDVLERAQSDMSVKGIKTLLKKDPVKAQRVADRIIKNTYRTLMTRGMKGCRVFCLDKALASYLKARLSNDMSPSIYLLDRHASPLLVADDERESFE